MHALVTGPGGFLGRYIAEQLLARGDTVRGFARGEYPELVEAGVEMVRGDLVDRDAVVKACEGVDCVFHVAGRVGVWGHWFDYFQANVQGTLNLLGACQEVGVGRLVFTSSPSVTFDAADPERAHQRGIDESPRYPKHKYALHGIQKEAIEGELSEYPTKWLAHYPHSKAVAEQLVLAENGHRGLRTCSLRPHLVWGPRDTNLTARLIERAKTGKLRRVGDGQNKVDMVYVENAAEAHLQAADALAVGDSATESAVAGKAYFLSQGEPVNCWQWIDQLLALADLPPVDKSISATAAYRIGWLLESAHWWTRRWNAEPRMTRFVARSLSTDHWFDIAAAKRDFGYSPRVSTDEGMQRLGEWLRQKGKGESKKGKG